MSFKKLLSKKGFLLIELLIAIAIMGILTGIVYIGVAPQITKAKDAKIKEDLIQIRNSLTLYYDDNKCFPDALPACGTDFIVGQTVYYKNFPCDPNGKPYVYQTDTNTCHQWFKVLDNLGNLNDQGINAAGCTFGCGALCNYNYGISSTNIALNQGCVKQFACSPSGSCIQYANPNQSKCPVVYPNDATCQNQCQKKQDQCHDESGKQY